MEVISIKNLSYTYNPKTPFSKLALNGVDLNIEEGEFLGIIGPTGCGKSTLIQHFNALIKPQAGEVNILGTDTKEKKADLRALRAKVGMVFQYPEYQLFSDTVFNDVAFGYKNFFLSGKKKLLKKREDKISKQENRRLLKQEIEIAVKEAIAMVGLDYEEIKSRSPFEISGGQKRRAAIAGVIVTKPQILILDEPTAGLDPAGKKEILSLMHTLHKVCSHTVIMISHDMDEIARNCTKIAVMNEGKILGMFKPAELFADAAKVNEFGLDLPTPVKIARALNKEGFNIPENIFLESVLAEVLARQL